MRRSIILTVAAGFLSVTATALGSGQHDSHAPVGLPSIMQPPLQQRFAGPHDIDRVPTTFGLNQLVRSRADRGTLDMLRQLRLKQSKPASNRAGTIRAFNSSEKLLVVYDYWSEYAFIGELYARQMKDLLSHFGWDVNMVPVQNYTAGMIGSHRATVYMGVFYDTDLPAAFKNDVMNATKPVCWTGYNLWKLAWNPDWTYNKNFETKFGLRFLHMDEGFYQVNYKATNLGKQTTYAGRLRVLSSTKTKVLARLRHQDGTTPPYITQSGNLWVVADNPIEGVQYVYQNGHDRTLAFCDVLHDVTNSGIAPSKNALVRIEDVGASADPALLRQIADILHAENVPFVVSTIPFYRDPLGYWNGGLPYEMKLNNATEVLNALQYMVSKGGQIVMHGYTHQYNDVPNYNSGVSGDDWEFFRVAPNGQGGYEFWGPVWEDSTEWVKGRIDAGLQILQDAGLGRPKGWLTPHYLASATDYAYFAGAFEYSLCPPVHYTIDAAGYLYYQALFAPYPIKDEYGTIRLPETLSYVSPNEPNMSPQSQINRAKAIKVVRDGWAGLFFHPFLDPQLLKTAVQGVKNQGFTFVNPSASFGPVTRS